MKLIILKNVELLKGRKFYLWFEESGELFIKINFLTFFQRQLNVQGYECSSDLRYVLFRHNVKPVSSLKLRRSF